jgi:hypothetical protein
LFWKYDWGVEIDVQSVIALEHLLLYTANAFNGILFMNARAIYKSRNYRLQSGTNVKKQLVQTTMLITELEWACFSPLAANHTCAVPTGMLQIMMIRPLLEEIGSHVNYDGVNVYGDEVTTNIKGVAAGLGAGAITQVNMQLLIISF